MIVFVMGTWDTTAVATTGAVCLIARATSVTELALSTLWRGCVVRKGMDKEAIEGALRQQGTHWGYYSRVLGSRRDKAGRGQCQDELGDIHLECISEVMSPVGYWHKSGRRKMVLTSRREWTEMVEENLA
jgi:hypothetical protein